MGARIRVTGGPWPERIGCLGRLVDDELDPRIYPRHGRASHEVIVLLDDDPIVAGRSEAPTYHGWSCVLKRRDVEVTPGV